MGMGGDSVGTQNPTPYGSIRIQTSTQGVCIPVVFGTQRITGNLIWAGDFVATPVSSGGGGKGGGNTYNTIHALDTKSFVSREGRKIIQGMKRHVRSLGVR